MSRQTVEAGKSRLEEMCFNPLVILVSHKSALRATSWPGHSPSGNQKRFWRDPTVL
jgi:hypothetical protein